MAVVSGFRTVWQPLGRGSGEHCAITAGRRSLAARRPPQFPKGPFKKLKNHSPLRGSRRDKGFARSRSGGGQTRRRVSEIQQWVGGAGQVPPTASAFAIRLGFCDSPTATDARRWLPLRRTRSRLWLALCEPPTASAFAIRLGFCDSPTATDARQRLPLRRTRSRLWLALCEPPTASAFAIRLDFCDSPSRGSDIRVMKRERSLCGRLGTWFTSCPGIGQEAWCRPQVSLPP